MAFGPPNREHPVKFLRSLWYGLRRTPPSTSSLRFYTPHGFGVWSEFKPSWSQTRWNIARASFSIRWAG